MSKVRKNEKTEPRFLARHLPVLQWLPHYSKSWLTGDIIAGLSVWALMVPQALGYAAICGVPVQYGLYAAAIGLIVYAFFASSRHVVTGPNSAIAAVTGAAVLSVAHAGSSDAIALVAAITMLAGVILILLSILKMGWISNFLAESVLTGFIFGVGIEVAVGQLKHISGTKVVGENCWTTLIQLAESLPQAHAATLIVGIIALVLLFALKIFAPKIPSALIALVLGIGASTILDLQGMGVAVVGKVSRGFPTPALPVMDLITQNSTLVVSTGICVALVGFSEALAAARQYASKYHYDIDVNQEILAQGMANVASGIFQSISVSGSLSKSSVNVASGGRSQMASLAQGAFVILTFLLLAPLFANLPKAVLGAIVIQAVVFGLMDIKAMKRIYRLNRTEFRVGVIALLSVLTFGTLQGVINGLLLSLVVLVARVSNPEIPILGRLPGTNLYRRQKTHPDGEVHPGLVIIRLDGALFFATTNALRDKIRSVTSGVEPAVKTILIDMEGANNMDLQGADTLGEIAENLKNAGVELHIARVKQAVMSMLKKVGVDQVIGRNRIHNRVFEAVNVLKAQAEPKD